MDEYNSHSRANTDFDDDFSTLRRSPLTFAPQIVPDPPAILPSTVRRIGRITLQVTRGPDTGKLIEHVTTSCAGPQRLRGGRSPVGDIVLGDPRVEGAHFDLELQATSVVVRDLDSASGVFLANIRVREAYLAVGDSFVVGDSELRLVSAETVDLALAMTDHFGDLYGRSPAMRSLFCDLTALTERGDRLGVLLHGQSGTGKEQVARELHAASMRGRRPFIVFAAAAVTPELALGLLLGQARNALPAATQDPRGCLEAADGGTLYIKDVDLLSPALQLQLHRALQEGGVTRVGEQSPRPIDVRVLCSTRGDLRRLVAAGGFRPELYYRIAGATITVPPLDARDGDIEFLAEHFLRRLVTSQNIHRRLSRDALAALQLHPWPNNVAGLRDAVERGFFASDHESICRSELDLGRPLDRGMIRRLVAFESLFGIDHADAVARFETLYFRHLLRTHPSKAKATRTSGMTNEGFRLALRRLKLSSPDTRHLSTAK